MTAPPSSRHAGRSSRRGATAAGVAFMLLALPAVLLLTLDGISIWGAVTMIVYLVATAGSIPIAAGKPPVWLRYAASLVVLALGVLAGTVADPVNLGLLAFGLCLTVVLLPLRHGVPLAALALIIAVVLSWPEEEPEELWSVTAMLIAVSAATALVMKLVLAHERQASLQAELAALEVSRDRERMSRDLHDILGHSISSVLVKARLARSYLERGHEALAGAELSEIEILGTEALSDIRQAVLDLRHLPLSAQLSASTQAANDADIVLDINQHNVPQGAAGYAIGHFVREGVTNVLRHSNANRIQLNIDHDGATLSDNGPPAPPVREGTGLTGLRERLEGAGFTLTIAPKARGGILMTASRQS